VSILFDTLITSLPCPAFLCLSLVLSWTFFFFVFVNIRLRSLPSGQNSFNSGAFGFARNSDRVQIKIWLCVRSERDASHHVSEVDPTPTTTLSSTLTSTLNESKLSHLALLILDSIDVVQADSGSRYPNYRRFSQLLAVASGTACDVRYHNAHAT
jgi:hypothetical protein